MTNSHQSPLSHAAIAARYSLSESDVQQLAANLENVRDEIGLACRNAGRSSGDVTLVAVTKYVKAPVIAALCELGVGHVGESRPQNLATRRSEVESLLQANDDHSSSMDLTWHLIGHLQRNKAELALRTADVIHSCDSERLLTRLHELLNVTPQNLPLFLEINISGEASKHGFTPEAARTWWRTHVVAGVAGSPSSGHMPTGLMTMAPLDASPAVLRQVFGGLMALKVELEAMSPGYRLPWLSMGMSGDFHAAIECGATHVRIGSRLFEGLSPECFLNSDMAA